MLSKYSLVYLIPYLRRYQTRMVVGLLMVFLTVMSGMCSPWVLKYVVDDIQAAFAPHKLPQYAAMILGIALVEGFFRFWMRRILIGVSREIEYDLRNDLFAHLQKMSLGYFQARNTGDIMSRATNDLSAVRSVVGPGIMYSATTIITVIVATSILLRLNWRLTLLAYIPLAAVSFTVKMVGQQIHDRFEKIQEQFSNISTRAQENLSGIRVVKAFAREESEIAEFEKLNHEYVSRSVSLIRLWGIYYPLMSALIGMSSVALLWWGGRQVITGQLSLGEFVAFLGYLAMLTWPTIAIGWVINLFQRGTASMDRLLEIFQMQPEIVQAPDATPPERCEGNVSIRDLSFRYPGFDRWILRNVTVRIPAGQTLAIVGPTGSGKTTLINLISRLYEPPEGTIFIDGRDVRHWPVAELRRMIGSVPQETFLLSDTIHENITFGGDDSLDEDKVRRAAQVSHIEEDILIFPKKYQTYVGERGITLSGGQKQRVAISRAVILQPRILVLDDSLSSVDTYTEERILSDLSEVMEGRTTILVSHRISTVKYAHLIIVLREGKIVERGTHDELMALQGAYADLYQKQLLEEELASA